MDLFKEFAFVLFIIAFFVVFFVLPAIAAFRQRMNQCTHLNYASFTFGPDKDHTMLHCFRCGCSNVDGRGWADHGVRSGDELNEMLAELDEVMTPEEYTGDELTEDDVPPALALPSRIMALWQRIGCHKMKRKPTHLVLGKKELLEAMALLVAGLERAEEWALAARVKEIAPNVKDEFFLRLVQERLTFQGMSVRPDLTHESNLAIESE